MSIEIAEEVERLEEKPFLPPTVLAVKASARSGLLLSMGIIMFLALAVLSVCDFGAGVILLPLGVLMLLAHIVVFSRSKTEKGSYGLPFLGIAYILPLLIECIFALWENIFDNMFISPFFKYLREIAVDLSEPFYGIVNRANLDIRLIFSVLALAFWIISLVIMSLVNAKRKNMPEAAVGMLCFVVLCFITAATFGAAVYSVVTGYFPQYLLTSFFNKSVWYIYIGVLVLIGVYSLLASIYCMKIFVKMKRVKNAVFK